MSISPRKLRAVTRGEALSLLAGTSLGRIVFTEKAMPAVRPASHLMEDGVIIVRSHDGSAVVPAGAGERIPGAERVAGAGRETVVAYQVDDIDIGTRLGWSVVVTGPATPILDPAAVERYSVVLAPWTSAGPGQLIRIYPGIVTGYRLIDQAD
jgi:Pyridoxamine 5'-phosphate oxidase